MPSLEHSHPPDAILRLIVWFLVRLPLVDFGPGCCQRGFGKMILSMTTTAEFYDASVRHNIGVMIRGWEGKVVYVYPSECHSYLLA